MPRSVACAMRAADEASRAPTIRDVVWPALHRLARDLPIAGDGRFWRLFELLTRESLTLPIVAGQPRFSGICADGTPWQFCISLGAAVVGGLRYLTEIGMPATPMSRRVALSRARLEEVIDLLGLPPLTSEAIDALFGLLPRTRDELDALHGGIWVGVGTGTSGEPGIRLYANNEWGGALARWQRLANALKRLRAFGFARLLRDHVEDLTPSFSPAGLACTLGGKPILKLYLRPRRVPWEACSRLVERSVFQLPSGFLADVEAASGIEFATAPPRLLLLSIGGSADGDAPDLKLDLNGQYLFRPGRTPRMVVEALATAWGIDHAPYRRWLDIVQSTAPAGSTPVHDFIGVGGGGAGPRMNVYLRPPMPEALAGQSLPATAHAAA